jgi:hypothetical protein
LPAGGRGEHQHLSTPRRRRLDACAHPNGDVPVSGNDCQCGAVTCSAGRFCTAAENFCATGPTCTNIQGTALNNEGTTCKCGTVECDGETQYAPSVGYFAATGSSINPRSEVTGMFCFASENRCAHGPECTDWKKFADDSSLQSRPGSGVEDGVNYLVQSCTVHSDVSVSNGQTLKISKGPAVALDTEIILDRRKGHDNGGCSANGHCGGTPVGVGRHFRVSTGGKLELTRLTFIGGNYRGSGYGGFLELSGGEAVLTECILANNMASHGGAIAISSNAKLSCNGCTLINNAAKMGGSGGTGGGLYISNGEANFIDSVITGSKAMTYANGLVPYGPAIAIYGDSSVVKMYDSDIYGNLGRPPIYMHTNVAFDSLTLINMRELQSNLIEGDSNRATSCSSGPNTCKDNGFWDPCTQITPDLTCSTALAIDTISCDEASAASATRQATECATTGTLHLSLGLVSGHLLGTPDKVLVGRSAECTITSSSETQVNCTVAASAVWGTTGTTTGTPSVAHTSSNAEGHLVQIINVDGDSTYLYGQSPLPRLLFAAPNISSDVSFLADTAGGESFTVRGSGFGPHDTSTLLEILIGGEHATQIAWISDSEITFVSPALPHNAKGNDPGFVLNAAGVRHGSSWNPAESELGTGGQSWQQQTNYNAPIRFSYAPPSLERVDSLKQSAEIGASGIPVTLHGAGFADVNLTQGNVRIWTQKAGAGPQNQITCGSIVRVSDVMLTCLYPDGGGAGCTDRDFYVSVAGQTTATSTPLCYLAIGAVRIQEAGHEVAVSSVKLDEGRNAGEYIYDVVLSDAPEDDDNSVVTVCVTSNSAACYVLSETLTFSLSSWSTPQSTSLRIAEDNVDQEDISGNLFASCTISHTVSSTNPVYNDSAIGPVLRLDIVDDDVADSKIRPTTISSNAQIKIENYHLKFLGPLTMVEGGSEYFGVQLDTKPTAEVTLRLDVARPRNNTPASVSVIPTSFVFRPDEWNTSHVYMAEVIVAQDDVDSAADLEDFILTYSVSTADSVYAQKSSNLTLIVRVQDDDTAGIDFGTVKLSEAESPATTLELIEGDGVGSILTIRGLLTRPLADVTLDISSSLDSLIQFDQQVIHVKQAEWNMINTNLTIRALEGDYGGKSTATIFLTPRSDGDPKYNGSDAVRGEQPVAIALRACGAGEIEVSAIANASMSSNVSGKCAPCPAGKFKGTLDETCRLCLSGTFGARKGSAACSDCIPGKIQPHLGKTSCQFCEKGRFQPETGQGTCRDAKSVGEFVPSSLASGGNGGGVEAKSIRLGYHAIGCDDSGMFCTGEDPCPAGSIGTVPATHECVLCPRGKRSPGGLTSCVSCEVGKFNAQNGSAQCVDCNVSLRLYADVENSARCKTCDAEEVSTGKECRPVSEDLRLQVPAEVKILLVDREGNSDRTSDERNRSTTVEVTWRLNAGEQGIETPASYIVMLSPDSDFPAGDRATFSDLSGSGAKLSVSQAMASSLTATVIYARVRSVRRGLGMISPMISPWSGSSHPWRTAETCSQSEYLATGEAKTLSVNLNPHTWRCELCPFGASCEGSITWGGVKPKFGFARCPQQPHRFEACSFQAACLGGGNEDLAGKFEQPDGTDPAVCNTSAICPETCNTGYTKNSLLCSSCGSGYSHAGIGGKCDVCPSHGENVGFMVLGFIGCIVGVFVFIRVTLSDAGEVVDTTDGVKTILLSFVQMLTLLTTFPIKWPVIFEAIFQVGGTVTVLGEQFVNLKCLVPSNSDADVFFAKSGAWALVPLVLMLTVTITWVIISRFRNVPKLRPKIFVSCIALLFLIYPTLCAACFNIFACRTVCGEDVPRLLADMDEKCWEGRHLAMVLVFALPMLFAYVFGFPLAALLAVHRLQKKSAVAVSRTVFRKRSTLGERLAAAEGESNVTIVISKSQSGFDGQDAVSLDSSQLHKSMKHHEEHFVLGMFYSSFRGSVWWWQATVALRKGGLALIGVFGSNLGLMQVHLTMLLLLVVIMITSKIEPYGGQNAKVMHELELLTLLAVWCTLWAGSVFNTYPKCADPDGKMGDTLQWCEALSVLVGLFDIGVTVVCVVALVWMNRKETKERARNKPTRGDRGGGERTKMKVTTVQTKIKPITHTIMAVEDSAVEGAEEELGSVTAGVAKPARAKPTEAKSAEAKSGDAPPAESNLLLPPTCMAAVSGPPALSAAAPAAGNTSQLEVDDEPAHVDDSISAGSSTKTGSPSRLHSEELDPGTPAVFEPSVLSADVRGSGNAPQPEAATTLVTEDPVALESSTKSTGKEPENSSGRTSLLAKNQ